MNCLVTGAAGFIGSHLCEALLKEGHQVTGLDALTDFYDPAIKRANLSHFLNHPQFCWLEADLVSSPWAEKVEQIDWIFHLAARAGVRTSWGDDFSAYCEQNILATQMLLKACIELQPKKIVFASSSSVYGNAKRLPIKETIALRPISPYGATKVAAEHLCRIYQENFGLPICILRYFTVYGPRQRPDMAFSRWISALRVEQPIQIFGDGNQTRDFTFVADTVRANMLAAERGIPGEIYNIAGGSNVSPRQVIEMLAELTGLTPKISWEDAKKGDPRHTLADVSKAKDRLGFTSQVSLREGLAAQVMDSLKRSRESVGGE